MSQARHAPAPVTNTNTADSIPFRSAEEAWFWFAQAYEARHAGARIRAAVGSVARPCEPLDIFRVVDRLYRHRRLLRDHLAVLVHYGRRLEPPRAERAREVRAAALWQEALERLLVPLQRKGIVL